MSRRTLILEEMGLSPRWRLRASRGSSGMPSTTNETDVEDDVRIVSSDDDPGGRERGDAPIAVDLGQQVFGTAAAGDSSRQAISPLQPGTAPSERRDAILQMDWSALKAAVEQCTACPLHIKRHRTVFGVGDERASWLFVGEGPGAEEDAKGEPFVGQAGRLLDNMLAAVGMKRGEDVYIANVVKCRPPNNRNPESAEMSCCEPYLTRQIELIRPKLIVAMGKIAASHLLRTDASIASLRGKVHEYRATPLIVTYHPAYLLRTLPDKAKAWTDLCFARDRMDAIRAESGKHQSGR